MLTWIALALWCAAALADAVGLSDAGYCRGHHLAAHPVVFAASISPQSALDQAQAALAQGDAISALQQLPLDLARLPPAQAAAALAIRARAELLLGRTLDAIATTNQLRALQPASSPALETALLAHLRTLDPRILRELHGHSQQPATRAWIEPLLPQREPVPGSRDFLMAAAKPLAAPQHIAVLLPQGGAYTAAAQAIQAGIAAAHGGQRATASVSLTVWNTGPDDTLAWERYQDAVAAGADRVIGPLSRAALERFAVQPALPVPVIALNERNPGSPQPVPGPLRRSLFRLALDPETEARQAATDALTAGFRQALIVAQDDPLGQRLQQAFQEAFSSGGGRIQGLQQLPADGTDFRAALATLPWGPTGTPDRLVFLATTSAQARMLWPQLRHLGYDRFPVWATSHVFSGHRDPRRDADLDGLRFLDIPGLITPDPTAAILRQNPSQPWPRLVALGHDAFLAAWHLVALTEPGHSLAGLSGQLRLEPDGRIARRLVWAQFVAGEPYPLAAPASGRGLSSPLARPPP